jgi:NTP pyrophosphatase (non-canonical NTP hydrolase)
MSQFDSAMDMVFHEIRKERERQIAKWGVQRHDDFRWLAIFQEELGEVCQAILQERHDDACQELIQSAAVLVAWLEHIFMTMEGE